MDPIAVASAAGQALRDVGWPGISLMQHEFQLELVRLADGRDDAMEPAVSGWYETRRSKVAAELRSRLTSYMIDHMAPTARVAMSEALANYEQGNYLSVVRTLMPEFEAFARNIYQGGRTRPKQSDVLTWLKGVIAALPVTGDSAIELFSLYHFIDDKLFATCSTAEDAKGLGDVANRHAEMHGLASYGHLKGATTLLCVTGFLIRLMDNYRGLLAAE
ncbi:hypothetical protein [Paraburkholderia humisilvae]|uniref:Uncharacterized protein n=1 Tax=Paraburkholderia humisilvae TaxID=627669 RepID=A0A6J5DNW7_9BURK|nr:hypothetical protein [Paraburkholderia humisilvae]CAB3754941.1 hypothetical protein LMG29542_02497 [Paraburkholderia humisilvae]